MSTESQRPTSIKVGRLIVVKPWTLFQAIRMRDPFQVAACVSAHHVTVLLTFAQTGSSRGY